jgi:hypothetical protein
MSISILCEQWLQREKQVAGKGRRAEKKNKKKGGEGKRGKDK